MSEHHGATTPEESGQTGAQGSTRERDAGTTTVREDTTPTQGAGPQPSGTDATGGESTTNEDVGGAIRGG